MSLFTGVKPILFKYIFLSSVAVFSIVLLFQIETLASSRTLALSVTEVLSPTAEAKKLQSMSFNKPIDYLEWTAKIKMSFEDLLKNVGQKIDLFRYDQAYGDKVNPPYYFLNIPKISDYLLKIFYRDIIIGRAQAIYIPEDEAEQYVQRPTILMRNDSDHWTLIHEYTHHLFHEARQKTKTTLPPNFRNLFLDAAETLEDYYVRFKNYGYNFIDNHHKTELMNSLLVAADLMLQMQINFSLEEVTIENMIRNYYVQNVLEQKRMDLGQFANSTTYIGSSFEQAQNTLSHYEEICTNVGKKLDANSKELAQVKSLLKKITQLKKQIKEFKVIKLAPVM